MNSDKTETSDGAIIRWEAPGLVPPHGKNPVKML
jgi:hypothetical protein